MGKAATSCLAVSSAESRFTVAFTGQPTMQMRIDPLTWALKADLQAHRVRRTSLPEKTGLVGPLPGRMQLFSVVSVAVLLEPYSDSGAVPDVTLVTSNSTYPAYPANSRGVVQLKSVGHWAKTMVAAMSPSHVSNLQPQI